VAFGEAKLCEGLLELLDLHIRNYSIIYLTTKCLFHICDGNQVNRMTISFRGGADFLMNCLTKYSDESKLTDFILGIMIGMCFDKVGQSRLGTVGMTKHSMILINKYEKSNDYLTLLTISLIGILANNSKDNKEKFFLSSSSSSSSSAFPVANVAVAAFSSSTSSSGSVHKALVNILQKAITNKAAVIAHYHSSGGGGGNQASSISLEGGGSAENRSFLSSTFKSFRRAAGGGGSGNNSNNSSMINLKDASSSITSPFVSPSSLTSPPAVVASVSVSESTGIAPFSEKATGSEADKIETEKQEQVNESNNDKQQEKQEESSGSAPSKGFSNAYLLNNNSANANVTLTDYVGESSMVKECCRTIYYLCYDHEGNRSKFTSLNIIDQLTTVVSSSSLLVIEGGYTDEDRNWARKAMDIMLTGSSSTISQSLSSLS
jgi:hypothetical protein